MESQPQNPEFMIYPETFTHVSINVHSFSFSRLTLSIIFSHTKTQIYLLSLLSFKASSMYLVRQNKLSTLFQAQNIRILSVLQFERTK